MASSAIGFIRKKYTLTKRVAAVGYTVGVDVRTFYGPAGERLDVAIAQALAFSRTYAKELVTEGFVMLNGAPVGKPAHKLTGAEVINVMIPPPKPMLVEPEDLPVHIIYEDEHLAAIYKPAGIIAHPTATVREGTVVNALLGRFPLSKEKLQNPTDEVYRPGIVHRLDKDTSGVMVVAKTDEAHKQLQLAFKKRLAHKEYIALARGALDKEVHIDAPIGRHPVQRQTMTVGGENPKGASTRFRIIASVGNVHLVKATPRTGRTHQIRVHLQYARAPIVGDTVYGRAAQEISRQALHAFQLTVPHPATGEAVTFTSHVPVDMVAAWEAFGGSWPPKADEELL